MEVSTEHTIVVTGKGQNMPLLTEVRQGKLGCSEGESPSRLMEESVFRTKEKNGKV
jgi:hypothetical protein